MKVYFQRDPDVAGMVPRFSVYKGMVLQCVVSSQKAARRAVLLLEAAARRT